MFLFVLAVISLPVANAQITNVAQTTAMPQPGSAHIYIQLLDESVNAANGSVSLYVNIPLPKGVGAMSTFRWTMVPMAFRPFDGGGTVHDFATASSVSVAGITNTQTYQALPDSIEDRSGNQVTVGPGTHGTSYYEIQRFFVEKLTLNRPFVDITK